MRRLKVFGLFLVVVGCGSSESGQSGQTGETTSLFTAPANLDELSNEHFFDHPFPSDFRVDADGSARFTGFPNPRIIPLITSYLEASKGLLHGFSPTAGVYLRFTGPIDTSALPADPPASIAEGSAVQIVDVDPASPEQGKRKLAQVFWRAEEGVYWQPNTLAVLPMFGQPLRPKTKYAVVVTSKVNAKASAELAGALGIAPATGSTTKLRDLFAPALATIEKSGVSRKDIAHMTVFTTNDPTEETFAAIDDAMTTPAPNAKDWAAKDGASAYDVYEGNYGPSPNYQAGNVPYKTMADGGGFVFENGKPKVQNTFDLRFALAVPNAQSCPVPATGYPIVIYAHGTGGDYRSFLDDGTAGALATDCLASMGVDQIFHGTRPGAPPLDDPNRDSIIQLLFFNLDNVYAGRTNNRQSAVDVAQQARLFTETKIQVPANVSKTGAAIAFDGSKLTFFGHSQGGLNGPLFLAGSNQARGAVLSGAGSVLALALLEKTKPLDITAAVRVLVGLSTPDDAAELNAFHPIISLAQSLVDTTDTTHYGRFIVREPRAGHAPKSIYQTEGVNSDGTGDTYAPPHGIEALSVSIGLPRMAPGVREVKEGVWSGLADLTIPGDGVSGNLAGGQASGVLAQFVPKAGSDGHFVVFRVPEAKKQAAAFLQNLAADPKGKIPAL